MYHKYRGKLKTDFTETREERQRRYCYPGIGHEKYGMDVKIFLWKEDTTLHP